MAWRNVMSLSEELGRLGGLRRCRGGGGGRLRGGRSRRLRRRRRGRLCELCEEEEPHGEGAG